ncbi:MAG TPA: hypothetical protein VIL28_02420 [Steroidobacteraceae bacterium]
MSDAAKELPGSSRAVQLVLWTIEFAAERDFKRVPTASGKRLE